MSLFSVLAAATMTFSGVTGPPPADLFPASIPTCTPRFAPVFGHSADGRPLTVEQRSGAGTPQVTVLVIGVVHGQEDAGRRVLHHLRCLDVPAGVLLVIVPTLNPDGEVAAAEAGAGAYDTDGVFNAHGVNLNRNFPSEWETGTYYSSGKYHSGPEAGSEPETQAFMRLAQAIRPDFTVSLHQPWDVIDAAPGVQSAVRYGELVGMNVDYEHRPGTLTGWMHEHGLGESFVVEFGVNDPMGVEAFAHAQAILTVAEEMIPKLNIPTALVR